MREIKATIPCPKPELPRLLLINEIARITTKPWRTPATANSKFGRVHQQLCQVHLGGGAAVGRLLLINSDPWESG